MTPPTKSLIAPFVGCIVFAALVVGTLNLVAPRPGSPQAAAPSAATCAAYAATYANLTNYQLRQALPAQSVDWEVIVEDVQLYEGRMSLYFGCPDGSKLSGFYESYTAHPALLNARRGARVRLRARLHEPNPWGGTGHPHALLQ